VNRGREYDADWRNDQHHERVLHECIAGSCRAVGQWNRERDGIVRRQWQSGATKRRSDLCQEGAAQLAASARRAPAPTFPRTAQERQSSR